MKKKFGVIILALLLMFAFVGCGSNDNAAEDLNNDGVVAENDGASDNNAGSKPEMDNNTGDDIKDDIDNLGEDLKDGVEKTGDAIMNRAEEATSSHDDNKTNE